MGRKRIGALLMVWSLIASGAGVALAQQEGEVVYHNGKLVTVDDHGFNSDLGSVAQAMYVKDGKIVQVGDDSEILALAESDAQVIDLKGRMVLPGFILTHEHPWDWNSVEPPVVTRILTDDVVVTRFLEGSSEGKREGVSRCVGRSRRKGQARAVDLYRVHDGS